MTEIRQIKDLNNTNENTNLNIQVIIFDCYEFSNT